MFILGQRRHSNSWYGVKYCSRFLCENCPVKAECSKDFLKPLFGSR